MKRNFIYYFLAFNFLFLGLTACFEDQSTEADHVIPEIEIDTTGIGEELSILHMGKLTLNPSVSKEGTDPSEFSYKWMLSMEPVVFGTKDEYICISTDATLDTQITLDDASDPYCLWYQVTDNTTGLRKDIVWKLYVKAAYNEGLLVAESHDNGLTTDLAFIESEQFTYGHKGETKIYHNLFSNANKGAKIESEVTQICAMKRTHQSYPKTKFFGLIGQGEDKYLLLDKHYAIKYRNEEGFHEGAINNLNPTQLSIYNRRYYSIVNNGTWHTMDMESTDGVGMVWGIPNINSTFSKGYPIDKMVAHGYKNLTYTHAFYDNIAGKFYTILVQPMANNGYTYALPKNSSFDFDPQNCPNLETIYGALGPSNVLCMLMKNKETGKYFVLGIHSSQNKIVLYAELPECNIDEAIGFAANEAGNVVYYATKNDIYVVVLAAVPVQVNKIHSFSDEITHFSFFRQARATTDVSSANLPTALNTLLTATWNGNEGTIHTIPVISPNVGGIDASGIVEYKGFGKISTITHQDQ